MGTTATALGASVLVGGSLLAGALWAAAFRLPERIAAVVTAFAGGLLLAAVALELVPEADDRAGPWLTTAALVAGTLLLVGADAWLTRDRGTRAMRRSSHAAAAGRPGAMDELADVPAGEAARGEAIAAGLVADGVPESLALGLTIAEGEIGVALLVGIAAGNVLEAYGAAQPIVAGGHTRRFAVGLLGGIAAALAGATLLGATALADAPDAFVGTAEALAAGAVLAVVSISIVPHAFATVSRTVATATVLGFAAGYLLS